MIRAQGLDYISSLAKKKRSRLYFRIAHRTPAASELESSINSDPRPCGGASEARPGGERLRPQNSPWPGKGKESRKHFPDTTEPDEIVPVDRLIRDAVRRAEKRRRAVPRTRSTRYFFPS